jgi:hypothetical protein
MDDDPDKMLIESWIYYALFWLAVLSLVFLSACTPIVTVDHEVPQLDKIADKIVNLKPPVTCRKLDIPPVPDKVRLKIDGDKIEADKGGETVLRGFVACRSLYKDAPGTVKP